MTIELLKKLAELGYVTDTAIIRECELKPELLKTINIYEYVSQIDLRNLNLMDGVAVDNVPVAEPEPIVEPEVNEPVVNEPEPEISEETKEPEPIVESEPEISEETKEPTPEPEIEVEDKKEEEKLAAEPEPEPEPIVEPEKVTPKAKTKKTVEKTED